MFATEIPLSPLARAVEEHLRRFMALQDGHDHITNLHARVIAEVELALLRVVLAATGGNQLRAAEVLGINRNTLRKKLSQLSIDPKAGA